MKSTFLFLVTTTMMTCTALGQPSNDKKNVLPDMGHSEASNDHRELIR